MRITYADKDGDGVIDLTTNHGRAVIDVDGDGDMAQEILDEDSYYPFGLEHKWGNNNIISGQYLPYKYNGTELEQTLGVDIYEMPLRAYDPAIARWNRIDPVTHFSLSTYNGFDNNPVYYADPSGGDGVASGGNHYGGTDFWQNDRAFRSNISFYSDTNRTVGGIADDLFSSISSLTSGGITWYNNGLNGGLGTIGESFDHQFAMMMFSPENQLAVALDPVIVRAYDPQSYAAATLNIAAQISGGNMRSELGSNFVSFGLGTKQAPAIGELSGWSKFMAEAHENLPWLLGSRKSANGNYYVDPNGIATRVAPIAEPVDLPFGPGGGANLFKLKFLKGQPIKGNATAIGRMDDLKKYNAYSNIDTWHKSGRIPKAGDKPVTWPENRRWLQARIDRGDSFIMTMNPNNLPTKYIPGKPNGWFTKLEYDYLVRRGAKIINAYK